MDDFIEIHDSDIQAIIALRGAELVSLKRTETDSVLWKKDPSFWNRTAPNLFPVVGRLVNDSFEFGGEQFNMTQHGFARDVDFEVEKKTPGSVVLKLVWNESSCEIYPFKFELRIHYTLHVKGIDIVYSVFNVDEKEIGFSIGGHPGFQLKDSLEQYKLGFSNPFTTLQHHLEASYFNGVTSDFVCDGELFLSNELFVNDAIVFKKPPFEWVSLEHQKQGKLVTVTTENLDAIGFWTKKDAPFFCIEPWWGWADAYKHSGKFNEKSGLHWLQPEKSKKFSYSIYF
jgi:galactose mutarotase-like enzyme